MMSSLNPSTQSLLQETKEVEETYFGRPNTIKKGLALAGKPENGAIAQNFCGGRIPLSLTDSREKTLFFQLQVLKHLISSEQIEQKRKIQVRPRGKNDPIQPAFLVTPPSQ